MTNHLKAFATMLEGINKDKRGSTMRSKRFTLASLGFSKLPAVADIYCSAKGMFFDESAEYQIAALVAVNQIGE